MNISGILLLVGLAALAYFAGKILIKGDNRVEERRRHAIKLAAWTDSNGLPGLSRLATCYAVGDYSGLVGQAKILAETLGNDQEALAIVDGFLRFQLTRRLSTPEGRETVIRFVEENLNVKIDRAVITPSVTAVGKTNGQ